MTKQSGLQKSTSENYSAASALQQAAAHGNIEKVKYILENNKNMNVDERCGGATALHYAAANNHLKVAEYLISKGANIHAKHNNGDYDILRNYMPIHFAARFGKLDMVKLLSAAEQPDRKHSCHTRTSPLYIAVEHGHADIVKTLLEPESSPYRLRLHDKDSRGFDLMGIASYIGHFDVIKVLLSIDKDLVNSISNSKTPLHHAVMSGRLDIVKYLIEHGANVTIPGMMNFAKNSSHGEATNTKKEIIERREEYLQELARHKNVTGSVLLLTPRETAILIGRSDIAAYLQKVESEQEHHFSLKSSIDCLRYRLFHKNIPDNNDAKPDEVAHDYPGLG